MKRMIKVIMSVAMFLCVLNVFAFDMDQGVKVLDSEETRRACVSDTIDREEHSYIMSYAYKNGLDNNPFKYVSVNHAISYINKATGKVIGVVTFLAKFKYNKKDKQAVCLSTSWGSITESPEYTFNCFSRKANITSGEGGGIFNVDFKYKGMGQDCVEFKCLCDYIGNLRIL